MALEVYGRLPTVPEYYRAFIDPKVDLTESPKQCCPFHREDTPSFSYDVRTGRWSCFGACHAHGDAVDMHMRWFKFKSRDQAELDLNKRCGITIQETKIQKPEDIYLNTRKIDLKVAYMQASMMAKTPERWVELDEVMSKYPLSEDELYNLYVKWREEDGLS